MLRAMRKSLINQIVEHHFADWCARIKLFLDREK